MKKFISAILILGITLSFLFVPTSAETLNQSEASTDVSRYADTDEDGIEDAIENAFGFDPEKADTDGDGVNDYIEFYVTHTDVCNPDGDLDSDEDGLTNLEELALGTDPGDFDSDSDGLWDGFEIRTTGTDPLVTDCDGDGLHDGLEYDLGLNPWNVCTDGVTLDSETAGALAYYAENAFLYPDRVQKSLNSEIVDNNSVQSVSPVIMNEGSTQTQFNGVLYTEYITQLTENISTPISVTFDSNVTYMLDFSWFFNSNTEYNQELAITSSLLSASAYADNRLVITGNTASTTNANSIEKWMSYHGFSERASYNLNNFHSDWHVSEMFLGNKVVTYNGVAKTVICVIIRGTNSTQAEWSSNFDMGSTSAYSPTGSEWTKSANHRGFDITANRLDAKLDEYISTYCSGENYVLWITGHSRGGALANVLAAKRVDWGDTVFAYTFASPNTTQTSTASNEKYNCIFNIINEDDFVTDIPLNNENLYFRRYGRSKGKSVNSYYSNEWYNLTGDQYETDLNAKSAVIAEMVNLLTSRNMCYTYPTGAAHDFMVDEVYISDTLRDGAASAYIAKYPSNTYGTYSVYEIGVAPALSFGIKQQPAFMMQYMATAMTGLGSSITFAQTEVAPYLFELKYDLISYAVFNGPKCPHYVESYYLLANKISSFD